MLNNSFTYCSSKSVSQSGSSGIKTTADVEAMIDMDCFDEHDAELARELAFIITEVLNLQSETITVNGEKMPSPTVKAFFCMLRHEHVKDVIERYRGIKYKIKAPKAYLRTSLYNSVFEAASKLENLYAVTK